MGESVAIAPPRRLDSAQQMDGPMPTPAPERDRISLPLSQLLTLSIYWLGIQTIWGGLNITIIPGRLDDLSRETQGTMLAIIMIAGAVAPIVIQPTVGVISDYTTTRWGRRKPYIVVGALLDVVFLLGIATANSLLAITAFVTLLQFSTNTARGAFQGYVPDLVPDRQVGLASAMVGLMQVFGNVLGFALAAIATAQGNVGVAVGAIAVVELVTMLSVVLR